jgi:glycosyltransferase involved in cell wall biosynthesis
MSSKKVLIITYYWPPSGGSGVQRWLKFSKYLPQFGWTPIVYTPENPSFNIRDESLEKDISPETEVINLPIWEPYDLFSGISKLLGKKDRTQNVAPAKGNATIFQRLSTWVRGNLFIPDPRIFWVKPSVRFLSDYIRANKVDVIISTGPPHSMHLIALRISKKFDIPWLADFRDPWTTMDYYKDLRLTTLADNKHHGLESRILKEADAVVVIGGQMKAEFETKRRGEVLVIPNGYDEEDFDTATDLKVDEHFSFVHAGSFVPRRNPHALWKAFSELKRENHPLFQFLKIKLIGRVDQTVLDSIHSFGLDEFVEVQSYTPHHAVVEILKSSQVLLLPIDNFEGAQWVLTGKIFEYMAARRPILCIGPIDGDAARMIDKTQSGKTFDFEDVSGIKTHLVELFDLFRHGSLAITGSKIEAYSRKGLTGKLAAALDKLAR